MFFLDKWSDCIFIFTFYVENTLQILVMALSYMGLPSTKFFNITYASADSLCHSMLPFSSKLIFRALHNFLKHLNHCRHIFLKISFEAAAAFVPQLSQTSSQWHAFWSRHGLSTSSTLK